MKIAVTGHRPQHLGGFRPQRLHGSIRTHMLEYLKAQYAAEDGDLQVISGCALGVDTWWAEIAIELGIPVILAIPFEGFNDRWGYKAKENLEKIKEISAEVHYICDKGYAPWKMQRRNEWMVRQADRVVAYHIPGKSGGTANCIRFAKGERCPLEVVDVTMLPGWESAKSWMEAAKKAPKL